MFNDLQYAIRSLSRNPVFAIGAVATLAVGIGVNSTIFTLSNAMLFRPLPGITQPTQLVWVSSAWRDRARMSGMSYPDYLDYREASQDVFSGLLAFRSTPLSLGSGGDPRRIRGQLVTGSYFQTLGVTPAAGRLLAPADDQRAGQPAVVLSYSLWQRRFNGSLEVLQQPITINGRLMTVVGVAAAGFTGAELGEAAELWAPVALWPEIRASQGNLLEERGSSPLTVMARLREGVTLGAARSVLTGVASRLERAYPDTNRNRTVALFLATSAVSPEARGELVPIAALLLTVTSLVLLIACANVANLLLARGAGRSLEIGIRAALGASRARLVRQLLIESGVLAVPGSAAGLLLSFWTADLLVSALPAAEFEGLRAGADLRVLGFTALLAAASVAAFGLVPALASTGRARLSSLRATSQTGGRSRLQGIFVVAQLSLSLVLLLGAGLSLRALQKAASLDLGFNPRNVLNASYDLALQNYPEERRVAFRRELVSRLEALPGVTSVAIANLAPLTGTMLNPMVSSPDDRGEAVERRVSLNAVGPQYFRTLEIPIVRGREFTESDGAGAPLAAVVNETLARRLWGSGVALGRRIRLDTDTFEVIGVARDSKYDEATEDPLPFMYVSIAQRSQFDAETLLTRTGAASGAISEQVLATLRAMDPALPVFDVRTLEDLVRQRPDKQRATSMLFAAFGAAALSLTALGLYGVMAYAVTMRRREMGVRLALGASPAQLTTLIVSDGLRLALMGVAIGSALALPLAHALGALVFGIQIGDFAAFAAACVVLIAVAVLASLLPARRAGRLDPMVALRSE